MRLAALAPERDGRGTDTAGSPVTNERIDQALLAHLCRCTGWQTIDEAARLVFDGRTPRRRGRRPAADLTAAAARAAPRGRGAPNRSVPTWSSAGPASPTTPAPPTPWSPCPTAPGGYAVAGTPAEARALAGKVQGRSTRLALDHPVARARPATGP